VTDQRNTRIPQFFLTPGGPCPYLPGRIERKVFARLGGNLAQPLSEALTRLPPGEAAAEVSKALNLPRKPLYKRALELKAR
jgi:hypothetical protein